MFRRNKVFLFQEPLKNKISRPLNQGFNHRTQVIIWGSLAKDLMRDIAIREKNLHIKDHRDIYAFIVQIKENVNLMITVKCKSNIEYHEIRKKHKEKTVEFKHDDKITCEIIKGPSPISQYYNCEPIFNSDIPTLIYIVGKNKIENNAILDKLTAIPNINNPTITMCHFFKDGQVNYVRSDIVRSDIEKIQVRNYSTYSIHTLAKEIFEKIKKCQDDHVEKLKTEEIIKINDEILQGFKSNIEQKADEFFDQKSSSFCFR